jgi:hypothetical protein
MVASDVDSTAWFTDPLKMDDSLSIHIIFEKDPDHFVLVIFGDDLEILDEPFFFQNLRDLSFHF